MKDEMLGASVACRLHQHVLAQITAAAGCSVATVVSITSGYPRLALALLRTGVFFLVTQSTFGDKMVVLSWRYAVWKTGERLQ
jgi:hypothetical protein